MLKVFVVCYWVNLVEKKKNLLQITQETQFSFFNEFLHNSLTDISPEMYKSILNMRNQVSGEY